MTVNEDKEQWISIRDAGNPPDKTGRGCVPYVYEMARCQLSNADWCKFLNAVGEEGVSRYRLFHKDMQSGVLGGIEREGGYLPKSGWERKPVVYVDYPSLLRYCNWLQTGNTEQGAYDLSSMPPRRLEGARFALPTADEWYKAAYWDSRKRRYFRYPTGKDDLPEQTEANYQRGDLLAVGPPFYYADVDSQNFSSTPSGVLQMGGNAWEFLEDVWKGYSLAPENTLRGGSFGYTETGLDKYNTDVCPYGGRTYVFGARIVHFPEGWRPARMPVRYALKLWIGSWLRRCVRRLLRRG